MLRPIFSSKYGLLGTVGPAFFAVVMDAQDQGSLGDGFHERASRRPLNGRSRRILL